MFDYIIGTYKEIKKDCIVIENNKIGYKIYTSGSTIAHMPPIGEEVMINLVQIVREDFIGLYGFLTDEELDMFNLLITINGVGAKAALSLLSISSVTNLKYAILTGDEKHITRAPGIGKKTAQRVILELKDKFKNDEVLDSGTGMTADSGMDDTHIAKVSEVTGALMALGYSEKEIDGALSAIDKTGTVESMIKESLKVLMR